jgi:hypothetical protein
MYNIEGSSTLAKEEITDYTTGSQDEPEDLKSRNNG